MINGFFQDELTSFTGNCAGIDAIWIIRNMECKNVTISTESNGVDERRKTYGGRVYFKLVKIVMGQELTRARRAKRSAPSS